MDHYSLDQIKQELEKPAGERRFAMVIQSFCGSYFGYTYADACGCKYNGEFQNIPQGRKFVDSDLGGIKEPVAVIFGNNLYIIEDAVTASRENEDYILAHPCATVGLNELESSKYLTVDTNWFKQTFPDAIDVDKRTERGTFCFVMAKNILREKSPSVGTGGPADEVKRAAGKEDHAILTV